MGEEFAICMFIGIYYLSYYIQNSNVRLGHPRLPPNGDLDNLKHSD